MADNFMARAMQRDTPAEHSDLRDWAQIRAWAREIAAELGASKARVAA